MVQRFVVACAILAAAGCSEVRYATPWIRGVTVKKVTIIAESGQIPEYWTERLVEGDWVKTGYSRYTVLGDGSRALMEEDGRVSIVDEDGSERPLDCAGSVLVRASDQTIFCIYRQPLGIATISSFDNRGAALEVRDALLQPLGEIPGSVDYMGFDPAGDPLMVWTRMGPRDETGRIHIWICEAVVARADQLVVIDSFEEKTGFQCRLPQVWSGRGIQVVAPLSPAKL